MKSFLLIIIQLHVSWFLFSAEKPEYKISNISPELRKNAKVVFRNMETNIEATNSGAVITTKAVISILNKNGSSYSEFTIGYDQFSSISNFTLNVYDENGKKVNDFYLSDMSDMSTYNDYNLFDDNRVKVLNPNYKKFPCTFEVEIKRKVKSHLSIPMWTVYNDFNTSIEKTTFNLSVPENVKINYLEMNMPAKGVKEQIKDKINYRWELKDLKAFSWEDYQEAFVDFAPRVIFAPENFELDGAKGTFKSWESFGSWYAGLIKDKDSLSAETISKIKKMVEGLDDMSKIQKLYSYMQERTHYISIQIGIGGWEPYDAMTVDRLAYGDCKALVNYMYTLLKYAGIKSYPTLIMAGDNAPKLTKEFPCQSFNHVILTVPINNDTLFLECTSQHIPAGSFGTFDDNRYALMIKDNKGVLIKTKCLTKDDCTIMNKGLFQVNLEGPTQLKLEITKKDAHFLESKMLSVATNDDIKKVLYNRINFSNFAIKDFSFVQPEITKPIIKENLNITIDQLATNTGNKWLLPVNIISRRSNLPDITENRKSKVLINRYVSEIDSVTYAIPNGYKIEKIPLPTNIENDLGVYKSYCKINEGNNITYYREFALNPGTYNIESGILLKEFLTKVYQADIANIVLSRN